MLTSKNVRSSTQIAICFVLAVAIMAGCGGNPAEPASPTPLPTQTSIQFSWLPTVEFAGFYGAEAHGHYADENLQVRFDDGGFDAEGNYIDPVQRVTDGQADFGIFSADGLMMARAAGQPVVAVATIFQRSPTVLFSLAEKNIRSPQDLIGKRIGVTFGSDDTIFAAMLATQNIDPSSVTVVAADPSLQDLLTGQVDGQMGFVTNEPVTLRQQGHNVNLLLPSDYGIDIYSNVIFTTQDTIDNRPDMIERFLRATLRGYEEAIADPEHAAELSVARNPDLVLENELASMNASLPLLKPAGSQVGMMTASSWEQAHQILLDQGILSQPIDVAGVYNLTFLDKLYNR